MGAPERARVRPSVEYPNGLLYESSFVTHEEEQALLAFVETLTFDAVEMRGQVARRTVRHFGVDYRFDTGAVVATEPIPDELETLRARAAAWIERDTQDLAEALVTRYPPGATIGWHRDAPAFGSRVVGISLLAPARMRFRRTTKAGSAVFDLVLEPRSGYVLGGAARASWQHSIPAVKELRYSVTFRTVRRARGADARAEES